MKAILFVGHGSKDKEGNEQVCQFINEMKPALDPNILVETCFLEFETPTVDQGIDTCVMKGASHVYIIPMMLLQAGHSKIHIPHCIDEAKKKYPNVEFTYGRPLGIHDEALEICISRLAQLGLEIESGDPETAIILLGRGGSDPDANSDLYKMARLLWEKLNYSIVEPAFMGVTAPLIDEVIHRCLLLGAKKIVILPYFLFTGVLIKRLEKIVQGYEERFKDHQFALAEYFGFHEKLQVILMDRVHEALADDVKMNCDTCQYRIEAAESIGHHHHHDHDHSHHDHSHHHHHDHEEKIKK